MSEQEPPKITFPCDDYPIKIMGQASAAYREVVLSIIHKHAPGFDLEKVTVRDSRKGNYQSLTVFITATGTDQLTAIFEDLKKHPSTRMVL